MRSHVSAHRRTFLAGLAGGAGLAACAPARNKAPAYDGEVSFQHGVASGDPTGDRVVIWTRVTPSQAGPLSLLWVVAKDANLKSVVRQGVTTTGPDRDYTVKVDVEGLKPGQKYHYGFFVGKSASPVGRTRTLPKGSISSFRIAVTSCSNHPAGFFNAYEALSKRTDVDLVLHLGDYIYEYGIDGYAGDIGAKIGRLADPPVEIVTLDDYRRRHAQYKADLDLQAAHAAFPWITVWDDHESANNSWVDGAENHNPESNEGDWHARMRAAIQAYFEWMPIRDPAAGSVREAIFRSFEIGDLATIAMLETRLSGRQEMYDYETLFARADAPLISTPFDFTNPLGPVPVAVENADPTNPAIRMIPTPFDTTGPLPQPILDYARIVRLDPRNLPDGINFIPDKKRILEMFANPDRRMMSEAQEQWLAGVLQESRAAKKPWQILGNQVIMARMNFPNFAKLSPQVQTDMVKVWPGAKQMVELSKLGLPLNPDAWDGYAASRSHIYKMAQDVGAHLVVVTGDTHEAYVNQLMSDDGKSRIGVEFGTTSISSPSYGDAFKEVANFNLGQTVAESNDEVLWNDSYSKGFLVLTLEKDKASAEFVAVSTVFSKEYETVRVIGYSVTPTAAGGVSAPVVEAAAPAKG